MKNELHRIKRTAQKLCKKKFTFEGGQDSFPARMFQKKYLKYLYIKNIGKELDFNNVNTFTEKLNWLKIYDRNPLYSIMADKYRARKFVADNWGEEYLIPSLGVWDRAEDIDFDKLPDEFILKCNHNSGGVLFCQDKSKLDIPSIIEEYNNYLNVDYSYYSGEWPYRGIPRKIVAEKYMKNSDGSSPIDYKLFSFNGEVKIFHINSNRVRKEQACTDYLDMEWNPIKDLIDPGCPTTDTVWAKPDYFDKMVELAQKVTKGIPFCRVDFLIFDDTMYFGEFTFFHEGGMTELSTPEWEKKMGDWLNLDIK